MRKLRQLNFNASGLLGGSAFIFFCRAFGAVIAFLTQMLLARWMGATQLGEYVLAFSWMMLLATIPVGGYCPAAAIRFIGQGIADNDPGYANAFVRHSAKVVLLTSIGIFLAGSAIILFVLDWSPHMRSLFLISLAGAPVMALMRFNGGLANAGSKFAISFLPNNVFRPLVFLALATAVWYSGTPLNSSLAVSIHVVGLIVVAVPTTVITFRAIQSLISAPPSGSEIGLWNQVAMSLLAVNLMTGYFQQITVIVIGPFVSAADIGIFNVGFRIALLISFSLFAVDAFTAPKLAYHFRKNERRELLRVVEQSTLIRFAVAVAAVLAFIFGGQHLLAPFGEEFVAGHRMMVILALAQVAQGAVGPAGRLLTISEFHKHGLYASAMCLVIWLVLTSFMLPAFGIMGVAVAVLIAMTAWSAIQYIFVRRHLGIDCLIFVRDLRA